MPSELEHQRDFTSGGDTAEERGRRYLSSGYAEVYVGALTGCPRGEKPDRFKKSREESGQRTWIPCFVMRHNTGPRKVPDEIAQLYIKLLDSDGKPRSMDGRYVWKEHVRMRDEKRTG